MRTFSLPMLFGVVALLSGCAETSTEEASKTKAPATAKTNSHDDHDGDHADHDGEKSVAMNANCPIMGSPVKPDGGSAEYNGKTVGFCCPGCVGKWTALSDEDKAKKLAEANSEGDDKPDA